LTIGKKVKTKLYIYILIYKYKIILGGWIASKTTATTATLQRSGKDSVSKRHCYKMEGVQGFFFEKIWWIQIKAVTL
jgi:hypothetical protein